MIHAHLLRRAFLEAFLDAHPPAWVPGVCWGEPQLNQAGSARLVGVEPPWYYQGTTVMYVIEHVKLSAHERD